MSGAIAMVQGIWVRRRVELLPPAGGPGTGVEGDDANPGAPGSLRPLRIGVLGESTAAGCGVESHREGFAGALARLMADDSGRPVRWHAVGQHGATARRIRHRLMPQLQESYDLVVVLAGANDVLARRRVEEWREDLAAIIDELGRRSERVLVAGTPPFERFPVLPSTLARFLAARGRELDEASADLCAAAPQASFVALDPDLVGEGFFARDGFHPGEQGYARWAGEIMAHDSTRGLGNPR